MAAKHIKMSAPELEAMKLQLIKLEFAIKVNTVRLAGIRSEFYQFI